MKSSILNNQGAGRIFLTGATGFLGSQLAAELLKRGRALTLLARPHGAMSARARVALLLDWLGADRERIAEIEVVEGYLDQPRLGIRQDASTSDRGFEQIIHCASDTSFSERKRPKVERANVGGVENVIEFAAEAGCPRLHYVSTAYAAGMREGLCRETFSDNGRFHNVYEESKCRAERLALEKCRDLGIALSVYRPSIVYGDSRNGRTMRFNALYYPIRTVLFLKRLYETDLRERGGAHAAAAGVKETPRGTLFMPIRIEAVRKGGLNLIPIDFFVRAFIALMEESSEGVFHLVNPRQTSIEDLISFSQAYFGIEGIEAVRNGTAPHPRNPLEALFDSYLEIYGPYIRDTRIFENARTRAFLASKGIECPAFDYHMFSRCIDYAVKVDWGRKLPFADRD